MRGTIFLLMKNTRIMFVAPQKAELHPFDLPAVGENQMRVKTRYSMMSTGTENIIFNRSFDPDSTMGQYCPPTAYPFPIGYTSVGTVVEVGAKVENFKVGDRVAGRSEHASESVADAVAASIARSGDAAVAVVPEGPYVIPQYQPAA